ncbi:MAG: ABC transporter substrate-binding protein [Clostridium sp.]|nr:ABC transporter substrate-binding protein [Clostridium sp.]
MFKKISRCTAAFLAATLFLTSCGVKTNQTEITQSDDENQPLADSSALSWVTWGGYDEFWELLGETYPDIEIDYVGYDGSNYLGYSWAQMRADDITDLFSTSQVLDKELAKERLIDLSSYDFMGDISTSILDQMSVDGGIYMLPVNNGMYGILYNKTLMEEHGWEVPTNFEELEKLCGEIEEAGFIPGILGTQLTGASFAAVFNLAKTDWLTTPQGMTWERDFLAGNATTKDNDNWEKTIEYTQRYIDIGMFSTVPNDLSNTAVMTDYMSQRKAVFFTMSALLDCPLENGDEWGMMPYISVDGSKNVYMYSPTSYIGISKKLAEPGNEEKLEKAVRVLSLMFSDAGQKAFIGDDKPCVMDVLATTDLPEDSIIYDAQQAMRDGRAFHMTYAGWENILSDVGQGFKEWFRGENDMDGAKALEHMDELQSSYLQNRESMYFCESTADFTLEETARLVACALGSSADADAAIVAYGTDYRDGQKLRAGVTGRLYAGGINAETSYSITPGGDGEYTVMTMTGAEAKAVAEAGFDLFGDGDNLPYVLVTKGDAELEDGTTYKVAFVNNGYTEEVGTTYGAVNEVGSLKDFVRNWLTEQGTVSPDKIIWE